MKYPHHIYVLSLLATIPEPIKVEGSYFSTRHSMTEEQAIDAWDHMFDYIYANFPKPVSADQVKMGSWRNEIGEDTQTKMDLEQCGELLSMPRDEFVAKLETLPPFFTDFIFPVAVGRYMLREMWMPMNHRKSRTFTEFHNRYGFIILGC